MGSSSDQVRKLSFCKNHSLWTKGDPSLVAQPAQGENACENQLSQ